MYISMIIFLYSYINFLTWGDIIMLIILIFIHTESLVFFFFFFSFFFHMIYFSSGVWVTPLVMVMRSVTSVTPFLLWLWLYGQSLRTIGSDTTVGIFRAFENMRDMRYMIDICDMLYGVTCFCILLIYSIYRAKYNKYQV